ncbi:MAG: hypothetical protein KBC69_00170 [Candidatus Magasanikbacteria bacterium]|nr:hypothetical protein [Candidatus Magasanikbacteria bacterium]
MRFTFKDLFSICSAPFVVFLIGDSLNNFYEPYSTVWWWNVLFHFLGGVSMAISGFFILNLAKRIDKIKTTSRLVEALLIIMFVMSVAVVWEFYEFLSDKFLYTHSQASNFDTMKDLCMGTLGAISFSKAWLIQQWVKK